WLTRLRAAEDASPYSLELRVSLDGFTAAENDALRGEGTFERILRGVRQLVEHGFLPILTVTQTRPDDEARLFQGFVELLKANGYDRPRIKILPVLRLGAEVERERGYHADERVTPEMMRDFDLGHLVCSHSRIVTDRGVYVCPILIEAPDARLGDTLAEAMRPFALRHHACFTCYQYGPIGSNVRRGGGARRARPGSAFKIAPASPPATIRRPLPVTSGGSRLKTEHLPAPFRLSPSSKPQSPG